LAEPEYPVEVKLIAWTVPEGETGNPESLIEYAGRLCWDTQDKTGTVPDRIQSWIKVGHESMIEHASATFYILASRVLTHELVRHRLASYSQRSQRYVKEKTPRYIEPAGLTPEERVIFTNAMDDAWDAYGKLLAVGARPEIARYVLPGACETQIVMTMNFRELRHFIKVRTSPRALPEMRCVAGKVRDLCKQLAPQVFNS